jgi:hypothetical protein
MRLTLRLLALALLLSVASFTSLVSPIGRADEGFELIGCTAACDNAETQCYLGCGTPGTPAYQQCSLGCTTTGLLCRSRCN